MKKCDCYHIQTKRQYTYNSITSNPIGHDVDIGVCWGVNEIEECSCGGDRTKCDFYPEICHKAQKDQEPKFGEWISVDDRLPNKNEEVLVYRGNHLGNLMNRYTYLGNNQWEDDYGYWGETKNEGVTHWIPLPNPPKGE